MTTTYPWSRTTALHEPSTYFYTDVVGPQLLRDWRASRDVLKQEPAEPSSGQRVDVIASAGSWSVHDVVERAYWAAQNDDEPHWLDLVCRRFEVSKQLHQRYGEAPPHRPPPDATVVTDPGPYLRFGEALVVRLGQHDDLRDLNALLKLGDTFAALHPDADTRARARMAAVLQGEHAAVARLAARNGVALP